MATTALGTWNAIKSRHEALRDDAKFKPDKMAPLCAKLDEEGGKQDKQKEEKEKASKILDDAGQPFDACSKRIETKHEEISQLIEQMGEIGGEGAFTGDDAAKALSQKAASFANLAKELAAAAQGIAKASDEQAGIVKKMAEQFKAKRESADGALKKIEADGKRAQDQIKKQVEAYQKIANGMKNADMAAAIGSLNSVVAQLYVF